MKKKHDLFDFSNHVVSSEPLQVWTERYGLEVKHGNCLACGDPMSTTIPIFSKTIRGLKAPQCECGVETLFQTYVLTKGTDMPDLFKVLG